MSLSIYLLTLNLIFIGITSLANPINKSSNRECHLKQSGIYVAISSEAEFLKDKSSLRWIEVYWYGINFKDGDYIGLWDHDPNENTNGVLETTSLIGGTDGRVILNTRWKSEYFPNDINTGMKCLLYWAAYIQNGTIMYSSCLSIFPNWMEVNKKIISSMGIAEILLPGSHDAGAYYGPDLLYHGDGQVAKWAITHDESLWQQMVLGVRYFDIRASYYPYSKEKFYINHGDVRFRPLITYLNQTTNFIESTNEIIVFDIHSFEFGFDGEDEAKVELADLIISWFGEWMAPQDLGPNTQLKTLWSLDKRIIVTFPEDTSSNLFWNNVNHLWANTNNLNDLYNYMDLNIPLMTGRGSMWSIMAEFTPSAKDVALNRWGGLRGAANITNEPVTLWLRREWWTMANIISMDFIASSDIINSVIEANKIRYICNITIPSTFTSNYIHNNYIFIFFLSLILPLAWRHFR